MPKRFRKRESWMREAKEWLEDARRDFEEARDRFRAGVYTEACFHSHQAAEKAIKALLYSRGEIAIGHNLEMLLKGLRKYGLEIDDLMDDAKQLNPHYSAARYPDARRRYAIAIEDYTQELADGCLKGVERIWERVREHLAV